MTEVCIVDGIYDVAATRNSADRDFTCRLHYLAGSIRLAKFHLGKTNPLQAGVPAFVKELHDQLPYRHEVGHLNGLEVPIENFIRATCIAETEGWTERVFSCAFVDNPEAAVEIEPYNLEQLKLVSKRGTSALCHPGERLGMPGRLVHLPITPEEINLPVTTDTAVRTAMQRSFGMAPHVLLHRVPDEAGLVPIEQIVAYDELTT